MSTGPNDKAFFCPRCGGAAINVSPLGGKAACEICAWEGPSHELATFHFSHDFSSQEAVANAFFLEVRKLMSAHVVTEFGRLLLKWGFLDTPEPKLLARYLATTARAIAKAILEERKAIEKEKHDSTT